jgi:hypothetical protein
MWIFLRRLLLKGLLICITSLVFTEFSFADSTGTTGNKDSHGIDPIVLGGLALLLLTAKLCGEFFERIKQPIVLGELLGGIIIGNLVILGFQGFEPLKTNEVIGGLAEIGVIILLFEVGLESNIGEMFEVGWSSLLVALGRRYCSFLSRLGCGCHLPARSRFARSHLYRGNTLCDKRRDYGTRAQGYRQVTGPRVTNHSGRGSN